MRTEELDKFAVDFIRSRGAIPAFKGYRGFPANICVSINETVVHGIPSARKIIAGDCVSIDVGLEYKGFFADAAITVPTEQVDAEKLRLISVTRTSLDRGIEAARINNRIGDISHAIQSYVESAGFSVVREYVGHGIGYMIHEDPPIPNFGPPGKGIRLKEGMVLAIEPMVNMGTYEVEVLDDHWTVVTKDRLPSAHFEHMVVVTRTGPRLLTTGY
ncbi:MAG: type I methionyl aminopeptidase [bacterium]